MEDRHRRIGGPVLGIAVILTLVAVLLFGMGVVSAMDAMDGDVGWGAPVVGFIAGVVVGVFAFNFYASVARSSNRLE
jgi:hypothetical protein